jgi:hypothetical protein
MVLDSGSAQFLVGLILICWAASIVGRSTDNILFLVIGWPITSVIQKIIETGIPHPTIYAEDAVKDSTLISAESFFLILALIAWFTWLI